MRFFSSKNISTTHDLEKNLLQIQLKRKGTLKDLIKLFSDALRRARSKKIKGWIFDLSQIAGLSEKSEYWVNTTLYPAMMIRSDSENYIGIVLSDEKYRQKLAEYGEDGLQTYNSFIKINTFPSREMACKWIEEENLKNSTSPSQ